MLRYAVDDLTFRLLEPEAISLDGEHYDRAVQLSDAVLGEACQWQAYISGLALEGFVSWIQERCPELAVETARCSLHAPAYAASIPAICNICLGGFTVCLLAVEQVLDDSVAIPRAVLELAPFSAHFYGLVEVQEERALLILRGCSRYDQLVQYRQRMGLEPTQDWLYFFPLEIFDAEPNHLLLSLEHLNPAAIVRDPESEPPQATFPEAERQALQRHLQHPEFELWDCLTWPQGAALLQNPDLLDALYRERQEPIAGSASLQAADRGQRLGGLVVDGWHGIETALATWGQPVLDARQWLQGVFSHDWFVPQGLTPALQFRSDPLRFEPNGYAFVGNFNRFEGAIRELQRQGMDIPEQAKRAYRDIAVEDLALRLCSVIWSHYTPEWSLLVLLGSQGDAPLPDGVQLQVGSLTQVRYEAMADLDDPFLFARITGLWGERFLVKVIAPNGTIFSLPPFTFQA